MAVIKLKEPLPTLPVKSHMDLMIEYAILHKRQADALATEREKLDYAFKDNNQDLLGLDAQLTFQTEQFNAAAKNMEDAQNSYNGTRTRHRHLVS
jgi:hypothetical protein